LGHVRTGRRLDRRHHCQVTVWSVRQTSSFLRCRSWWHTMSKLPWLIILRPVTFSTILRLDILFLFRLQAASVGVQGTKGVQSELLDTHSDDALSWFPLRGMFPLFLFFVHITAQNSPNSSPPPCFLGAHDLMVFLTKLGLKHGKHVTRWE
jgi:hypothetical protein